MYYTSHSTFENGNYTMFPNEAFALDLSMGEICVYLYLLYREDRSSYTCYPSANTIARDLKVSRPTVRKYVEMLERKGLINTEYTSIQTKKYGKVNGNLKYTILPIKPVFDAAFQKRILMQENQCALTNFCIK